MNLFLLHIGIFADPGRVTGVGSAIIEFVGTDLPENKWSEIRNFLKSDKK